jgi:hypothetical protein
MNYMSSVERYSGWRQLCVRAQPCMHGSGDAAYLLCMLCCLHIHLLCMCCTAVIVGSIWFVGLVPCLFQSAISVGPGKFRIVGDLF